MGAPLTITLYTFDLIADAHVPDVVSGVEPTAVDPAAIIMLEFFWAELTALPLQSVLENPSANILVILTLASMTELNVAWKLSNDPPDALTKVKVNVALLVQDCPVLLPNVPVVEFKL
jgi:hypothetical protein